MSVEFPARAVLIGKAQRNTDALNIECRIHFFIERVDQGERMNNEALAVMGGDAQRTVLDEHGDGISFWGDGFDSVRIAFPRPEEIVISSRIHAPTGESRFWDEFLRFEGTALEDERWAGMWNCYPLDTREDTVGIVEGTWTLEHAE